MSKKEKNVSESNLKVVTEDFIDVTRFGYDDDVSVEMSGQLFYALMRIIGTLANDEVKWMYQINPTSLSETAKEENIVNVISNTGVTYFNLLGELETLHLQNIKTGKTTDIEEIQAKIQAKINNVLKEASDEAPNKVPVPVEKPNKKKKVSE